MKHSLALLFLFLGALISQIHALSTYPIANEELRFESARIHLSGKPNQVAVYSKGLVCSSCGIGLRIHISKIEGIDTTQLDEGMLLDAKNQLVLIAFKDKYDSIVDKIFDAVDKAGYETSHYYQWDGQAVKLKTYKGKG